MYLLALASASAIFSVGVHHSIQHWSTVQYYTCLLEGRPLPSKRVQSVAIHDGETDALVEQPRITGGEDGNDADADSGSGASPVSYTHLTLPTICSV
eukprot:9850112-Alexandrium_andersonii.AAC.1